MVFFSFLGLSACGDGYGSDYSSARAQANQKAPRYVPVTPGAEPLYGANGPVILKPVTTTTSQSQVVVATNPSQIAPSASAPQLTGPVAITPGATPILAQGNSPLGHMLSPKPVARNEGGVRTASLSPMVPQTTPTPTQTGRRFAKGPIFSACRSAGRKEASQARCGCVQWVADQRLSAADQRRGAGYFTNQHALQETRQSDNKNNERFWKAWRAYGDVAAQQCSNT